MARTYQHGTLVRVQDLRAVQTRLNDVHLHVHGCVACCNVWRLVPDRLSLEQVACLPTNASGWCAVGMEIYVKKLAAAAEIAIKEAL